MVKQLVEVPETISQEGIQQRTVEQIVDVPVPQAVEELIEVSQVFPQDRVHQRFVEQTIDIPATSLAEMIVEVPVIQPQGKAQQVVNTHGQRVVDTVEVEKPKIHRADSAEKEADHPGEDQPGDQEHRVSTGAVLGTRLVTCPLLCNDRCPRPRQGRKQWRFHRCSLSTESLTSMSWRRGQIPVMPFINKVVDTPGCGAETDFPNGPDCSEDH